MEASAGIRLSAAGGSEQALCMWRWGWISR